ncbi:hypothetical protein, partial [Paracoccus thiocyanatus]|uniref:hypothetical protein n=1 Tax=Paracoccus thiocyanatus TaxID=34006 RepID=UPI001CB72A8C
GGYTASGQLPVLTKRGHYWAPKGGQSCVPIDNQAFRAWRAQWRARSKMHIYQLNQRNMAEGMGLKDNLFH